MSEEFAKQELLHLRNNPDFIPYYENMILAFRKSGLLDFLRSVARCYIYDGGANPARSAAEAHYNAGYHKALDDILYFKESFLAENTQYKKLSMSFGGRQLALSRGDLLPEDVQK